MENSIPKKRVGVDAVNRALSILSCFSDQDDKLTLTEISNRTGLYKSTVLRLIESLEEGGFLVKNDNRGFSLGSELMRLGSLYTRRFNLEDRVRPALLKLVEKTGESASFFRREGNVRVCLYRLDSPQAIRDHIREGDRLALDKGAAGHILSDFWEKSPTELSNLMSGLPYTSFGERDHETAAIGAPVFGVDGELMGALSVSGPLSRFTSERLEPAKKYLLSVAQELSHALGGRHYR